MPFLIAFLLLLFTLRLQLPTPNSSLPLPTPVPAVYSPSPSPAPTPQVQIPQDSGPWGVAVKTGDHTYRIRIQNDPRMGTPDEILSALNDLRRRHGAQPLKTDPRLCQYTQSRAELFQSLDRTDVHKGFEDFLNHQDGFAKLGYGRVGENSSYGYILSGVHLIEFVYMQSPEHNANQLDPAWDHGCVGVAGAATNLLFATSPL